MASIIATASGKGGVGKTLLTASMGIALARQGKKVLLIDGDMGLRNMDLILGLENDCLYNICDLAEGRCFMEDAILPVMKGLDFLPSSQEESWETVFPAAMDMVLEDIHRRYDYIFIDCPAGMGKGVETAFRMSSRIVVVVAPSWASRRSADHLVTMIGRGKDYAFVLNQFSASHRASLSFDDVYDTLDPELFGGVIPYSIHADRLAHEGELTDFKEKSAFGKSLSYVLRALLEKKEFPLSRWESFLTLGDRENEKETAGKASAKKAASSGLTWQSGSRSYRWQRRR